MSEKKIRNIFYQGPIPAAKIAADLQQHASNTDIGAHSIFIGQVRADQKETDSLAAIEYTAYAEMALEKMAEIRADLFVRYPLTCASWSFTSSISSLFRYGIPAKRSRSFRSSIDRTIEKIPDRYCLL
jgi:hypothetical protein